MAIDKLIPQYLNKDDDERLVKSMEMVDALNVRVSVSEEGNGGVVKNFKGNLKVAPKDIAIDTIPQEGYNRVIGSIASEAADCIYYFLFNSEKKHGIYRYSYANDNFEKLYESESLNFKRQSFVKADLVINQDGDHLLYFTDNNNEPRKINATKLRLNLYSEIINDGDEKQKELFFTVCKKPPLEPPTFSFETNATLRANHLKENVFQFTYQYLYDDGEISSLSPYSNVAVSTTNLAYDILSKNAFSEENNQLRITVLNTEAPVKKIRVYARRNNDGAFFRIKELDNQDPQNGLNPTQSFEFRNDSIHTFLSKEEAEKLFNAVPKKAGAQAISNKRLMYGDYLEGFNNVETAAFPYPVYHPRDVSPSVDMELLEAVTEDLDLDGTEGDAYLINQYYANYGEIANCAIYGDADTNGVSFEIDITEYPDGGIEVETAISVSIELSCSEFGIGARTNVGGINDNYAMNFPVMCKTRSGGVLIHEQEMFILNSGSYEANNIDASYGGWQYRSIARLFPQASLLINETIIVPPQGSKADFAAYLISAIQGLIVSAPVSADTDGTIPSICTQPPLAQSDVTSSQTYPQLYLWLAGQLDFIVESGIFIQEGGVDKLRFSLALNSLTLNAIKGYGYTERTFPYDPDPVIPEAYNTNPFTNSLGVGQYFYGQDIECTIDNTLTNSLGLNIADQFYSPNTNIRTMWRGFVVSGGVDILAGSDVGKQSFKAGATHPLGVVYLDHRGRCSAVQPFKQEVNVAHFGENDRGLNNGRTEIDIRVWHTPPLYAERWLPVYALNTTYERILQVTVSEAALGNETLYEDILSPTGGERPIIQALSGSDSGVIFISMRSLEGKNESYKEFKGAHLDYKFSEGDKLRVLEYSDEWGNAIRPLHEFVITGYHYFSDDDKNPIKLSQETDPDENAYRRTGWFLAIKDEGIAGFDRVAVGLGTDYFSQGCLVEIFKPKQNTEKRLYFEIGKSYPIIDTPFGRTHGGDRSNIEIDDFSLIPIAQLAFTSTERLYIGDRLINMPTASGIAFVFGILPLGGGLFQYSISDIGDGGFISFGQEWVGANIDPSGSNGLYAGVVTLTEGDVHFRVREQLVNVSDNSYVVNGQTYRHNPTKPDEQDYDKFLIESESVSDFFVSNAVAKGRAHLENPDAKEIRRLASITYSDIYSFDSSILKLSSFNPILFPYKDFDTQFGKIVYLIDTGESVTVVQESKVSVQPIGRTLIESAENGMLVTSKEVLGKETRYAGNFGAGSNPEGVVHVMGRTYFPDRLNGKVIQIGGNGIELISNKLMDNFFGDRLKSLPNGAKIPCGYDPNNSEFILTYIDNIFEEVEQGGGTGGAGGNVVISIDPVFTDVNSPIWDSISELMDESEQRFDEGVEAVTYLDNIYDSGSLFISQELLGSTQTIPVLITNTQGTFTAYGTYSLANGTLRIPQATASQYLPTNTIPIITTPPSIEFDETETAPVATPPTTPAPLEVIEYTGDTVAYSTEDGVWLTRYSFRPELYSHLRNTMFTFWNGNLYKHEANSVYGKFYEQQYASHVDVVSKINPSMIKAYKAMSLEASSPWAVTVSNSKQQTYINSANFSEKEGMWYSDMPKDNSPETSSSHKVILGEVASVNGNQVTFTSRVSNSPFQLGAPVITVNGADLGVTVVSVANRTTLVMSGDVSQVVSVGDKLMVSSDPIINGDVIRDYFVKLHLYKLSSRPVELYAVNAIFEGSPLHNEQVN